MRVLHANKFFYHRGGAETVYFATSDLLRRYGHEVIPFSMEDPRNEESAYARYFVSNVELREERGGLPGKVAAAARILYSREAEGKIDALIRDTRPDIAHLHNIYHQLSPSILRALHRHKVPVVMTLHDYKLICPAYTLHTGGSICERCKGHAYYNTVSHRCVKSSRLKSAVCAAEAYLHDATGIYRRNVKYFIAPSRFLASKVIEFGVDPRTIEYVPNFIEPGPIAHDGAGDYFVYAGRLERVKGVRTLLRAVAGSELAQRHQLMIAGDGEDRTALEAYASKQRLKNVRFLGHLAKAQLEPVLAGAAFAVVPSEWYENAPLGVLEAAARGKAVIASDLGGLPELVRHNETGLTFPAGDHVGLREAIEGLLRDPGRASEMGRRARAFVEETFAPDAHYRRLMGVYDRALGSAPSASVTEHEVAP